VFQVNDLPPLEFHDPFPLRSSGDGVFAVHWPEGVALTRLRALRQALPRQPSALERGDEAFGQGHFAEAFDHYRAQAGAGRAEARYKEALCLVKMQRPDDAARVFEQVGSSAESSGRWRMPALCQLWLLEVRRDHGVEADAVFKSLAPEFRFEQLAAFVPAEVREEMLRAYLPGGTFDLLRHNPHLIRNLERARDVEHYLKAPAPSQARTRYQLLQAYLVEDRTAQARNLAEELLRNSTLAPARRIDVLEDRVWLLLRDGQPQRALDEVNAQLLARRGESAVAQYRRAFLPLLLSRARIRANLKQWKEAEDDLKDLFRLMPDPGRDSTQLDAWLLRGFLREQQDDAKGALEAWRQGLALARRQRSLHVLSAAILASLSGEMTNQDAEQMVAGVLGDTSDRSPVLTLFRLKLFPFEELATGLRETWRSRRGHEYARRIAFRDISYGEMLSVQVVLGTFEGCRAGAFGPGELSAQEDALLWKLFNDISRAQRSGELAHEQVVKLLTAWAGSTGPFGWAGLAPKLTPEVRGPLAYVMGRRYLRLKKPGDAAMYFRTAQKEAPRDSDLWRLAEKELGRLVRKE